MKIIMIVSSMTGTCRKVAVQLSKRPANSLYYHCVPVSGALCRIYLPVHSVMSI